MLDALVDRVVYPGCEESGSVATYAMNGTECLVHTTPGSARWIVYAHGNMVSLQTLADSGIPTANTMDFDMEKALEYFLDPVTGSNATGKVVEGIINNFAHFFNTIFFYKLSIMSNSIFQFCFITFTYHYINMVI